MARYPSARGSYEAQRVARAHHLVPAHGPALVVAALHEHAQQVALEGDVVVGRGLEGDEEDGGQRGGRRQHREPAPPRAGRGGLGAARELPQELLGRAGADEGGGLVAQRGDVGLAAGAAVDVRRELGQIAHGVGLEIGGGGTAGLARRGRDHGQASPFTRAEASKTSRTRASKTASFLPIVLREMPVRADTSSCV